MPTMDPATTPTSRIGIIIKSFLIMETTLLIIWLSLYLYFCRVSRTNSPHIAPHHSNSSLKSVFVFCMLGEVLLRLIK